MSRSLRHGPLIVSQCVAICALSTWAPAQQPRSPQMPAPPPMRFVSRTERSQLKAEMSPKSRLKATLTMAEDHLARAESQTDQKRFDSASAELGSYLGLIGDLREFLATLNAGKSDTRDLYRHLEIAVRAHLPRLAVMRRTTPVGYAVHIKEAEEYIKDTRSAALDSFYGQSVLREVVPEKASHPDAPSEAVKRP
jgi:hypothetical protein